ncbi:MAG: heat-inducible transcriptional repressor HrcA [Firmicutes bacterium]|nr:heat-inducible transcriptional repressor HrcA [Bacillota bacterium]
MDMDVRKIKILRAIINDYINTGEPVGSRTIAKKYDLGVSPATIRNEMADLEDMGYLEHLHTSSGRKPSDKGYRLYVDKLMNQHQLTSEEEFFIKTKLLDTALFEMDKMLKQATLLVSELTKLTCIVNPPSVTRSAIKSLQLMSLDENQMLLIVITDNGIIKNNIIKVLNSPQDMNVVVRLNGIINHRLKGLNVEEINLTVINNLKNDLAGYEDIFNAVIPALYESLTKAGSSEAIVEGAENIFNYPEYNDIEKAKEFLTLLGNKNKLRGLLSGNANITIRIGNENALDDARDCSVITAVYKLHDKPIGAIGVIGPTRIQYSKVVTVLDKIVREINDSITHNCFDD